MPPPNAAGPSPSVRLPEADDVAPAASRLAVAAFVAACVALLAALWVTDRALARTGLPDSGALRLASWLLGAAAFGGAAAAVRYERRAARRAAERSAELERLSAELFDANRAKSEFLANVSHELRTPLNAVVGFADLLQEGVYGPLTPRQAGPVGRIASSAAHLRHLVDQILDLARIAAGRLDVHPELMALRPFVLDVAGEIESLVREKGLALSIGVPAGLPRLRSDPLHVRQVLVNLLGNAVKFTPAGGRVSVRAHLVEAPAGGTPFPPRPAPVDRANGAAPGGLALGAAGAFGAAGALGVVQQRVQERLRRYAAGPGSSPPVPWVAVQVADTGVGIAADHQARIFDEFERVGPRTGDGAERGTGLGLAISRRLAELLGGELTLESAPGAGSTFTLWLPVDPSDARPRGADGREAERRAGDRRRGDRRGEAEEVGAP